LTGSPSDKWGYAVQGALQIKNIPTGAGECSASRAYTPRRKPLQRPEPCQHHLFDVQRLRSRRRLSERRLCRCVRRVYGGTTAATGTSLQLTTTYGFRGAYTHNWDAHWNTGLYGAYGAIRYNGIAKV
jgi:hypothetical protein